MRVACVRVDGLERIVGAGYVERDVVVGDAAVAGTAARALVRPGSAREVAAVVAWCYERDVPIVPVGGRSGLAGGAAVLNRVAVAIALDRLHVVRDFKPLLWRMEAEAGVTTHTIARLARESGLLFPPDPGAPEQSQLGGTIATNAGGPHSFKYGVTGDWVTGIDAVLAPGELVRVGGAVRKDVAGYDLRALLCGSEGTLGIVTAAWLRLVPAPEAQLPVLASYPDTATGCSAIARVLGSGIAAAVLEYVDAVAARLVGPAFEDRSVRGFAVLAEADGAAAEARRVRAELVEALSGGADAVHAPQDAAGIRALWRWRAGVSHAASAARGTKLSEDVAVPLDRLAEAIEEVLAIGAHHGLEACSWGHAGDGNLHATFLLDPGDAAQRARADVAAGEVFDLALRLGGTVSGEHGIGVLKRGQLSRQWPPAAVAAHRAIKAALDPKGLFNPGKKEP
ncbi:MAG: glycolate oxidase [Solirubrobacteraceae bacterium]|nr:glycolate oxidase [Solirubrobacteraceae bacterium]